MRTTEVGERREIWVERSRPVGDEGAARALVKAWAGRLLDLGAWWVLRDGPSKRLDRVAPDELGQPPRKGKTRNIWRLRLARSAGGGTEASLLVRIAADTSAPAVTARIEWSEPWSPGGPELLVALARDLGADRGTLARPSPRAPRAGEWTLVSEVPPTPIDCVRVIDLGGDLKLVAPDEEPPTDASIERVAWWLEGRVEPRAVDPSRVVERSIPSFLRTPPAPEILAPAVVDTDRTRELPRPEELDRLIRDAEPSIAIPRGPAARAPFDSEAQDIVGGDGMTAELPSPEELRALSRSAFPFASEPLPKELPMSIDAYAAARALRHARGADDALVLTRYGVTTRGEMRLIDQQMAAALGFSPGLRKQFEERYVHFIKFIQPKPEGR